MDDLHSLLSYLTPSELRELDALLSTVEVPIWNPLPGPQTEAYYCEADELFYGGAAGGGKTDLLLGTSLQHHWRSIIFRREFQQLKGIRDRGGELFSDVSKFNGADLTWRIEDGRRIELGACQYEGDEQKYQGRPHDLKAFDEITHFTKKQFTFLKGWNRTTKINPETGNYYRCRVIAAGNPPTTAEGQWVTEYWAPWLNPSHPNPAKPGELRWFITNSDGEDVEVSGPEPVYMVINGLETAVYPRSRTFIRARIQDNPYLLESGYLSILQSLPEPLRSRMLSGDFGVGEDDDKWQVIPTAWIHAAQARWAPSFEEYLVKLATLRREKDVSKIKELRKVIRKAIEGTKFAAPSLSNVESIEAPESSSALPLGDPASDSGSPPIGEEALFENLKRGLRQSNEISEDLQGFIQGDPLGRKGITASVPSPLVEGGSPSSSDSFKQLTSGVTQGPGVDMSELLSPDQRQLNRDAAALLLQAGAPGQEEVGLDVSRGGRDKSVMSYRKGGWFDKLRIKPGAQTPDGPAVINWVIDEGFRHLKCKIDVVGVGSSPVDVGKLHGMEVVPMNGANASVGRDRSGTLEFCNARSEWMWTLREALDPSLGLELALPLDSELVADLAAARWKLTPKGIQVEDKQKIKERLGRSPDKGDAIINAFAQPSIPGMGFLNYYREEAGRAREAVDAAEREITRRRDLGQPI